MMLRSVCLVLLLYVSFEPVAPTEIVNRKEELYWRWRFEANPILKSLFPQKIWSDWVKGSCSATCGTGSLSFTRKCLNEPCVGESTRVEKCEEKVCPVWSEWKTSDCSVTCGKGIFSITRRCLKGDCVGESIITENCEEQVCPDQVKGRGKSCKTIKDSDSNAVSGIYEVDVGREKMNLVCNMDISGGGWTVFHNRFNGEVDFGGIWKIYESGFGDLNAEFWLGLKHLHKLTSEGTFDLRIQMSSFDGRTKHAEYKEFRVSDLYGNYRLSFKNNSYSGTAGDSLWWQNGMQFSTWDDDNDRYDGNCAIEWGGFGGFWYNACFYPNPNGQYKPEKAPIKTPVTQYMLWYYFDNKPGIKHRWLPLKSMSWMLREAV